MRNRPQTVGKWVQRRKLLLLSIVLRLFGYRCHSGLDPVGFRLIWVDWAGRPLLVTHSHSLRFAGRGNTSRHVNIYSFFSITCTLLSSFKLVSFWTNKMVDAYSRLNLKMWIFWFVLYCQVFQMPNIDMQCWFAVASELRLWMLEMGLP